MNNNSNRIYNKNDIFYGYTCMIIPNANGCKYMGYVIDEVIANRMNDSVYENIKTNEILTLVKLDGIASNQNKQDLLNTKFFALPLPCFEEKGTIDQEQLIRSEVQVKANAMEILSKKVLREHGAGKSNGYKRHRNK